MEFSYDYIEKKLEDIAADITDNYCLGRRCLDCEFNLPIVCGLTVINNSVCKQIKELKEQRESFANRKETP